MCLCLHQLAKRGPGSGNGFKYEKLCSWFNLFLLEDIMYNTIVCWCVNTIIISYRCLFVQYIWDFLYLSQLSSEKRPNCLINKAAHKRLILALVVSNDLLWLKQLLRMQKRKRVDAVNEWVHTGYKDDDWWQRQDFIQVTIAHVQCETRSQMWVCLIYIVVE